MKWVRRFALVFFLATVFQVVQPHTAQAGYWGVTGSGGCGTQCDSPQEVCDYWGVYYGGGCLGIVGFAYGVTGGVSGIKYQVWYSAGHEALTEEAMAYCPSGYRSDYSVPSGCSQWTPPVARQLGDGCGNNQPNTGNAPNVGDPVNVINGNEFEEVTDYESAGPQKLAFIRYYNSLSHDWSSLGFSWQSNFDRRIEILSSQTVNVVRCDGAQFTFSNSSGTWKSTAKDVDATLTTDGSTIWTFTTHNDTVETYDYTSGRLLSVTTRDGYQQTLAYGADGHLATVTDSYGRTLTFTYANGVLQTLTDPDGRTYTYSYDATVLWTPDRLISVTYPGASSPTIQYHYDATYAHALTAIIDENGNQYATWTYDAQSRVISSEHAGGADENTFAYNFNIEDEGTVTVTNALGKQTVYSIGWVSGPNVNKVTKVARQASASTPAATKTISYDANGYISKIVDYNGNTTDYTNDSRGDVLSKTEAAGTSLARTTTYTWDSTFHVPTQIVAPGRTTTFTYDDHGRLLTKTETDSTNGHTRSWSYTYTSTGEVATITGPLNNVTTYGYDGTGALVSITNALNQVTQVTAHDASGRPETVVDPNGVTTTLSYNPRGWLSSESVATAEGAATTTIAYDAVGNITRITRPDGSYLAYTYDAAHRLTQVADALGDTITYTLDSLGDRTQVQIAASGGGIVKTQSRIFDDLGRILKNIGAANQTTIFGYDNDSNVTSITDPLSNTTTRSFDALNRLIQVAAPLSATAAYGYDSQNNLTSATDPRGLVTTYVYDGLGDLIETISPDTGTTSYVTDAAGNRTQLTDAAGNVIQFTYDALSRLTAKTFPGDTAENITYTYDGAGSGDGIGRLTSVTDQSGTTSYVYNALGDVTQATRVINGIQFVTSYSYDLAGHVTQITYPSGRIVNYARDAMGRITSVTTQLDAQASPVTIASGVTYEPFGPLAGLTYGNGLTLSVQYDEDYQPSARTVVGTATIQNLSYGFDAAGDLQAINDNLNNGLSQAFEYDALHRLTQATGTYGTYTYGYDVDGNRTSMALIGGPSDFSASYIYASTSNQLQSVVTGSTTRSIAYTADGDAANDNFGDGTVFGYAYNENDRFVQASINGSPVATYTQDFLGRRVIKTFPSAAMIIFSYDLSGHLIAESDGSGNVQDEYIWIGGMPVAFIQGGTIDYIHTDHLGTPQLMTDANQNVVWDGTGSDPFMSTALPTTPMNLRFPGQYFDAETGLNYNYFRDYDPSLGRYVESDPIGLAGGVNTYAYVGGNPVNIVDPRGQCGGLCILLAAAVISGGADFLYQLYEDHSQPACVSWSEVGGAALAGAALGPFAEDLLGFGAAAEEAAAAEDSLVTVTHFTNAAGASAIGEGGLLNAGSFVTTSDLSGLSATEVESSLEIDAGKGAFSTTFQTPASNLGPAFNGPLTSGQIPQFQLINPARVTTFVPTGP